MTNHSPACAFAASVPVSVDLLDQKRPSGRRSAEVFLRRPDGFAASAECQPAAQPLPLVRLRAYAILVSIDAAAIVTGFMLANLVRFGAPLADAGLYYLAALLPVFVAIAFSQAAYSVEVLEKPRIGQVKALRALALAAGALLLALFYTKTSAVMSRSVFGMGVLAASGLLVAGRHFYGRHLGSRHDWLFQNEVLLVDRAAVAWPQCSNVIYAESAGLDPARNDPEMAHRIGSLLSGYDRIILNCEPERRTQWVKRVKGLGVDVEVLTPELDYLGALAMRRAAAGSAVLVVSGPLGLRDRIFKRALDILVATAMLIVFAPLLLFVSAAVKFTSHGPVLFRQRRIGRGNIPFGVLKFRTMRVEASDAHGEQSTCRADSRLTRLGGFLRTTSLDELPQLFNVLKGDMSIVGPRPHATQSTAANNLFWDVDERYWHRGAVKPGITGLAQVRGYRGATSTTKHLTDRVQSDLEYLANWSVSKDLAIMLRTAGVLIHPNAY